MSFFSFHPLNKRMDFGCRNSPGLVAVRLYSCSFGLCIVADQRYGNLDDVCTVADKGKSERMYS